MDKNIYLECELEMNDGHVVCKHIDDRWIDRECNKHKCERDDSDGDDGSPTVKDDGKGITLTFKKLIFIITFIYYKNQL